MTSEREKWEQEIERREQAEKAYRKSFKTLTPISEVQVGMLAVYVSSEGHIFTGRIEKRETKWEILFGDEFLLVGHDIFLAYWQAHQGIPGIYRCPAKIARTLHFTCADRPGYWKDLPRTQTEGKEDGH